MEAYDFFVEYADNRVHNWPLMNSPLPICGIILIYLLVVLKLAPDFMKNRKPYDLRYIIATYNLAMVLTCIGVIKSFFDSGITFKTLIRCQNHQSTDPQSMKLLNIFYFSLFVKMIEFIETVFFILRKKYNQVSPLHVYHHASTALINWIAIKYCAGGAVLFSAIINYGVHVIMYSYYFLTVFGPKVTNKIQLVKPYITIIQMVQFTMMIISIISLTANKCGPPLPLLAIYLFDVILIYYMFYDFYKKSYKKQGIEHLDGKNSPQKKIK